MGKNESRRVFSSGKAKAKKSCTKKLCLPGRESDKNDFFCKQTSILIREEGALKQ